MAWRYTGPITSLAQARNLAANLRRRGENAAADYLLADWQRVAARPEVGRRLVALAAAPATFPVSAS